MTIKSLSSPQSITDQRSRKLPAIAVDLGFSGRSETSGFACSLNCPAGRSLTFATSIHEVVCVAKKHAEIVLILEAPLSGRFEGGNPIARGTFEEASNGCPPKNWNIGAGAAVALAAIHFLLQLNTSLQQEQTVIHLLEGFVSGDNKPRVDRTGLSREEADKLQHAADAAFLLEAFHLDPDDSFIDLARTDGLLVTTKILGIEPSGAPAMVLKPRPAAKSN